MKKSLLIAAAALATTSIASSASAIDTFPIREVRAAGLPISPFLGFVEFTALGTIPTPVGSRTCDYLMNWTSPYNPNLVTLCHVKELRTPVTPSCAANARMDITTAVSAGPAGNLGPTYCDGFDNLGVPQMGVTLLLGEFADPIHPSFSGVAIYASAVPAVLPLVIS